MDCVAIKKRSQSQKASALTGAAWRPGGSWQPAGHQWLGSRDCTFASGSQESHFHSVPAINRCTAAAVLPDAATSVAAPATALAVAAGVIKSSRYDKRLSMQSNGAGPWCTAGSTKCPTCWRQLPAAVPVLQRWLKLGTPDCCAGWRNALAPIPSSWDAAGQTMACWPSDL